MKKAAGFYSILLGISIIGLWVMLLTTGNVPELRTEPINIYFHLTSEFLMAVLLLISGIGILKKLTWGNPMFILSNGLVIYSVINSAGYFGNSDEWAMVIMFMIILVLSIIFTLMIFKENYKDFKANNE